MEVAKILSEKLSGQIQLNSNFEKLRLNPD